MDIKVVVDAFNQLGRLIDHGHVIMFAGQLPGDVEADLAGAANDHFHDVPINPGEGRIILAKGETRISSLSPSLCKRNRRIFPFGALRAMVLQKSRGPVLNTTDC
jgi:hypothetical protein